jgi:hypothetical protein
MTAHTFSTAPPATSVAAAAATEVCRPLSPLERWYWIADQISPLNVIARAQVRGTPAPPGPEAMFPRRHRGLPGAVGALAQEEKVKEETP